MQNKTETSKTAEKCVADLNRKNQSRLKYDNFISNSKFDVM